MTQTDRFWSKVRVTPMSAVAKTANEGGAVGDSNPPNNPGHMANLSTGHGGRVRSPGRPPGSTVASIQAKRVAAAKVKLISERAAEMGLEAIAEVRTPLRSDAPDRTVSQAKEAALRLLNAMLWTIEKQAELRGVNEFDEQRLLRLLAGLNAALPKQAETPNKDKEEMSEDELRKVAGR